MEPRLFYAETKENINSRKNLALRGDMRLTGGNMIHNRDCGEGMKRLPDNCIDLTVTSPPYDNLREYGGFLFDIQEIATQLYRVTKDGGVVVWIVGDQMINGGEPVSDRRLLSWTQDSDCTIR